MKILIAEDDMIGRKLLEKFLQSYGECHVAVDGIEALEKFIDSYEGKNPYDLMCLDIMMPKLDGLKVLKAARNYEKKNSIDKEDRTKIIMTTALNDKKTVEQSYELGCDGYAWKPIDLDKFEEVLFKLELINEE
ncbi:MAG: response regulator [Bacillota bacterium]|nr:response regulator [Bacillota bacterium]